MSNQWQNKMYHYEARPSTEAWNRIAAALEDEVPTIATRFEQFEVTPPPQAWNRISASLEPVKKPAGRIRMVRIAAAAAAVLIVFFASTLLFKQTFQGNSAKQLPGVAAGGKTSNDHTAPAGQQTVVVNEQTPLPETEIKAGRQLSFTPRAKKRMVFAGIASSRQINVPEQIQPENRIRFDNHVDRYMVYSDGDGNAMRLSKKLYDAISCVQVERACKERLQQLQQKMAGASLTSDFTAVLEMLNNLRENQ